jgi:hypothetical protein
MAIHRYHTERFSRNAWEPIVIPRWALVLKYALFSLTGILTFIVGQPTISLLTFNGYEPIWAGIIGLSGLIAAIGALRPRWGALEAWAVTTLLSFMTVLIIGLVHRGSETTALLLLITYIVPLVRLSYLVVRYIYSKTGRL